MAFEIWAVTSNLLKGGGEIEEKMCLETQAFFMLLMKYKKIQKYKIGIVSWKECIRSGLAQAVVVAALHPSDITF